MKPAAVISLVALLSCQASAPPIRTYDFSRGEQVIQAMYSRYFNRWYHTLTYVQYNRRIGAPGDTAQSVWLTAYSLPSRLRIDYAPLEQANGVLVVRDTQFVMHDAVSTEYIPRTNPLLLLGNDVYYLPVGVIVAKLRALAYDMNISRRDVWMNRPVLVVGAEEGDEESPQFWVDRETMVLVRLIDPTGSARSIGSDIRLMDFQPLGRSWLATRVHVYNNGRLVQNEERHQIRSDLELDSTLFMVTGWETGIHWYQNTPTPHRGINRICC